MERQVESYSKAILQISQTLKPRSEIMISLHFLIEDVICLKSTPKLCNKISHLT